MSKSDSNNSRKDQARRNILKSVVAGGGAMTAAKMTPEAWVKPVVDAVVLPGHAATTDGGGDGSGGTTPAPDVTGTFISGDLFRFFVQADQIDALKQEELISEELLEFFMPAANADNSPTCANVKCEIFMAGDFSSTDALLCSSDGGSASFGVSGLSLTGGSKQVGSFGVTGGQYSATDGCWNIFTNVSSTIVLSPGGVGCR